MKMVRTDGGRGEGKAKGDCVCRAIAIATGMDYWAVHAGLIEQQRSMRQTRRVRVSADPDRGVNKAVYSKYLAGLGWQWVPVMRIGSGCTMRLAPGQLPPGRLIVRVSRHLTAVIDGVLHDTYDCTRGGTRCVYGYWKKGD